MIHSLKNGAFLQPKKSILTFKNRYSKSLSLRDKYLVGLVYQRTIDHTLVDRQLITVSFI